MFEGFKREKTVLGYLGVGKELMEMFYNYKELGIVDFYANNEYYPTFLMPNGDIIIIVVT